MLKKETLGNGLEVYWYHVDSKRVGIGVIVGSGNNQDPVGREGLHHTVEHLPFRGTKNFRTNRNLFWRMEYFDGNVTARTGPDRTVYTCTMPAKRSGLAIKFIADLVFRPLLRERDWKKEQEVILDEYRGAMGEAGTLVGLASNAHIFAGTPLARLGIGTESSIRSITIEDIRSMYETSYTSDNCIVSVTGPITPNSQNQIRTEFGSLDIPKGNHKREPLQLTPVAGKTLRLTDSLFRQACVDINAPMVGTSPRLAWLRSFYLTMMSKQLSSPTFRIMREKKELFYGGSATRGFFCYGVATIGFSCRTHRSKVDRVVEEFWKVLDKTLSNKRRFAFAKAREQYHLQSTEIGAAGWLGSVLNAVIDGDWLEPEESLKLLRSITQEELISHVNACLNPESAVTVIGTDK